MAIHMRRDLWGPNENTIAYRPLNSTTTYSDLSGNGRDFTSQYTLNFGTHYGVDCLSFSGTTSTLKYSSISANNYTLLFWYYYPTNQSSRGIYRIRTYSGDTTSGQKFVTNANSIPTIIIPTNDTTGTDQLYQYTGTYTGQRILYCLTKNGGTYNYYIKGENINVSGTGTGYDDQRSFDFEINRGGNYDGFKGCFSNIIIESKIWSQQEYNDYYYQTKDLYGIN